MKFSMKVEGGQDLLRRLQQLPAAVSRPVRVHALMQGGEPIREEASALAPYDQESGEPHLQDNIVVAPLSERTLESRGRGTETVVEIGPELRPDDLFYGFFQEFGTKHHPAQPFMRPAFDARAQDALEIIEDELWFAVRRGVDRF